MVLFDGRYGVWGKDGCTGEVWVWVHIIMRYGVKEGWGICIGYGVTGRYRGKVWSVMGSMWCGV